MKVGDLVIKHVEAGGSLLGVVLEVQTLREHDRLRLVSNEYIKVWWGDYGTYWTYDDKVKLAKV